MNQQQQKKGGIACIGVSFGHHFLWAKETVLYAGRCVFAVNGSTIFPVLFYCASEPGRMVAARSLSEGFFSAHSILPSCSCHLTE